MLLGRPFGRKDSLTRIPWLAVRDGRQSNKRKLRAPFWRMKNPDCLCRAQVVATKVARFRLALRLAEMTVILADLAGLAIECGDSFHPTGGRMPPPLLAATFSALLHERSAPVLGLGIISEINLRVFLAQVAEVGNGSQRISGGTLNQLRRKKLASMLMNVFP